MTVARTLVVLRHGAAEDHAASDFERQLVDKGRIQAQAAGRWMMRHAPSPDLVLASSAPRALQTAQLACAAAGVPPHRLQAVPSIYEANAQTLAALLGQQNVGCVWLVGHNPGLEHLVGWLAGDGSITLRKGALAVLEVEAWDALSPATSRLRQALRPGDL